MLSALTGWLLQWGNLLLSKFYNLIIDCLQYLIDCVPVFITAVLQLFSFACPPPPMPLIDTEAIGIVGKATLYILLESLNWLMPMQFFYYYVHFLVCAITAYLTVMVVFRWFKIVT